MLSTWRHLAVQTVFPPDAPLAIEDLVTAAHQATRSLARPTGSRATVDAATLPVPAEALAGFERRGSWILSERLG